VGTAGGGGGEVEKEAARSSYNIVLQCNKMTQFIFIKNAKLQLIALNSKFKLVILFLINVVNSLM
jgi:hypothetical protein